MKFKDEDEMIQSDVISHLKSCLADMSEALRVWGMPYLMPTPTRGSAFTTRFTADWSENANMIDAGKRITLRVNDDKMSLD